MKKGQSGQSSHNRSSHGGFSGPGMVDLLVKKEFMELASNRECKIVLDLGSGHGIFLHEMSKRDECKNCDLVGMEIDRDRLNESRIICGPMVNIIGGSFVPSEQREMSPDGSVGMEKIVNGDKPTMALLNNFRFCMLESNDSRVENSPEAKFVHEVNEEQLFCVGSIIIAYSCIALDAHLWDLTVYRVLNVPGGSLSWVEHDSDINIYKYKKTEGVHCHRRKSHRAKTVIVLDYDEVCGWFGDTQCDYFPMLVG